MVNSSIIAILGTGNGWTACAKNVSLRRFAEASLEASVISPDRSQDHPMQEGTPAEFDVYDQSYSHIVNRALAFSGMKVDFFARAKVDYFVELIGSLPLPAPRCEVIDVGCGVAHSHPLFAGRMGWLRGVHGSPA